MKIRDKKTSLESDILIPTSIFYNRKISFLEAIVKWLREEKKLRYSEISTLTERDQRNIWTIYDRASKKTKAAQKNEKRKTSKASSAIAEIPISATRNRSVSIMESVVLFMRESGFTNQQVAILLNRSRKTVSTVYRRAVEKTNRGADEN